MNEQNNSISQNVRTIPSNVHLASGITHWCITMFVLFIYLYVNFLWNWKKLDMAWRIVFSCPWLTWDSTSKCKPKTDQCWISKGCCCGRSKSLSPRLGMCKPKLKSSHHSLQWTSISCYKSPNKTYLRPKIVFSINHEYKLQGQDKSEPSRTKNVTQDLPQDL